MRKSLLTVALLSASTFAFAQGAVQATPESIQANRGGVNIQGNTKINASADNMNATATGKHNVAKNTVGAIKGGTNIKGNTEISASAKNMNANVSGKHNKAENAVGVIGGR